MTRRPRMTKVEIENFLKWMFSDEMNDKKDVMPAPLIAKEYYKATGFEVKPNFVNNQKHKYVKVGNVIKRYDIDGGIEL